MCPYVSLFTDYLAITVEKQGLSTGTKQGPKGPSVLIY